ncbi:MAG TPA: hypothetical protein ENH40_03555 [Nitrospirae bacterium]|nr:hypothetical protein [Nitrospirota bacterium]
MDKKVRTKYFSLKELRLSIAHIVLWSLLSVAFFTYLAIEMGETMERSPLYIIAVVSGYAIIVTVLTMIFTHRFLGPFERLKLELRIILSGNQHKRLKIRNRDDIYLRSFIVEINRLLDYFEERSISKDKFYKEMDSELTALKSLLDRKETPKDVLKEAIISLHDKIQLEEGKK